MTRQPLQGESVSIEKLLLPPMVCVPLLPVEALTGQDKGLCTAWEGEALPLDGGDPVRCVFKHLSHPGKLAIEMACALVSTALQNKTPSPCLVLASKDQLPELPDSAHQPGDFAILFGSAYVDGNRFFEQLSQANDATLDNSVWSHFCDNTATAAKGAALDELLANWDRHSRNMRFDGSNWWLIDHDQALAATLDNDPKVIDPKFVARQNQIASQLAERRRSDHHMDDAARLAAQRQEQVKSIAAMAAKWTHSIPRVAEIWQQTASLIGLMSRRMPMLQIMINERIGINQSIALKWTSSPTPPPPSDS